MTGDELRVVRVFLLVEIALFALAALLHKGLFLPRYAHDKAAIAESVIMLVLSAGLAFGVSRPSAARTAALYAQVFAFLGVCVGVVMIFSGIGPRSVLDYCIHAVMLATLAFGIATARRIRLI
jgi:hypothetical protein